MKRLTAILLALIYISTTSGIVISSHYCMGEISEIALGSTSNATCGTCGMENNGCCHDDLQVIKLTENHNIAAIHFELPILESPVQHLDKTHHASLIDQPHFGIGQGHSPPLQVSRNILFCVYRI
jgi:hypothetical protein